MDTGRRSGSDRRNAEIPVSQERRNGHERRDVLRDPDRTAGRLRTIPMFAGLSPDQIAELLSICAKISYRKGLTVFRNGEEPREMFVLVQGRLKVTFPDGTETGSYSPSGIVGGLGLVTKEKRTASVEAAADSILLVFRREELEALFERDHALHTKVLTNIISDLVSRHRKENDLIESLRQVRSFEVL
jgi:CRP-like cAMP-binding protein